MCTFCCLSSISAMPLPQTNCNKFFFFILFRQCHCHKFIPTIFFPSISAKALPQTNWNKFFSLLFRQCHCHNSILLFFVKEEHDKPNCFSKKKYWNNKNMRTFFYIFHLFRQCHCHKQQFFFSILFKFISTFFSPQFRQWHCHKLCTFFCFCLQHFKIRISYLCLESTYFFFCFCLHHFRIRICTWVYNV